MNEKLIDLINGQIQKEIESAYLYFSVANYYEENGLKGFANWFKVQAKEEMTHAEKFCEFLHDNNAEVEMFPIKVLDKEIKNIRDPLEIALKHEKYITDSINDIYMEAQDREDFRTINFLQWFIKEQLEEEVNAQALIDKFNLVKDCGSGMYFLDKELGIRRFVE